MELALVVLSFAVLICLIFIGKLYSKNVSLQVEMANMKLTVDKVNQAQEELVSIELSEATQELEKATLAIEKAESSKDRLDASVELKKATARLEAINYLS